MLNEEASVEQLESNNQQGQEDLGGFKKANPKLEQEIEGYSSALINVVYDKKTSNSIVEMLKGAPPEKSIPQAVLTINQMVEQQAERANKKPSLPVLLNSGILLTKELIDVGEAGGFFEISQEQLQPILQTTMQRYIEAGLKNKTIDPVELQAAVEPMMNDQQRSVGMQAAQATGVPEKPGQRAAMEKYAQEAVMKDRQVTSSKMAAKGQLQGGGQQ